MASSDDQEFFETPGATPNHIARKAMEELQGSASSRRLPASFIF